MKLNEDILSYQKEMKEAFRLQLNNNLKNNMYSDYFLDNTLGLENE